jgi:hypothetical protein
MAIHEFQRLCWRNIEMLCPAEWEMTFSSSPADTPRIILSDRRYERLKMQWRQLSYTPELSRVIEKHQDEVEHVTILNSLPEGWYGTIAPCGSGSVIHAGKFFSKTKMLVELILFWNKQREKHIEEKIMESIHPVSSSVQSCLWEAMGMKVKIPSECTLSAFNAEAGQILWKFMYGDKKSKKEVIICRIALLRAIFPQPDISWEDLKAFIESQANPRKSRIARAESSTYNGHTAVRIVWLTIPDGMIKRLTGYKNKIVEVAWACPVEEKIYRLSIPFEDCHVLSEKLHVKCCGDRWKSTLYDKEQKGK